MKKIFIFAMLGCFFFSCSKDNKTTPVTQKTDPPGSKTYPVNFKVAVDAAATLKTNSVTKSTAAVTPVAGFANVLQYWVYDSSGKLITQLYQNSASTTNFGSISDTFSAGTYNVVLIAQNNLSATVTPITPPNNYSTGAFTINGSDTFFKTYALTVSDTTADQNITLSRIDGQLQVTITDTIPASAKQIEIDVVSERAVSIATGLPNSATSTFSFFATVPAAAVGKPNFTATTYIANTVAPFTVNISAVNSIAAKFVTTSVSNVTCELNTRTLLSGNLFTTATQNGFTVTFNQAWDGSPTVIPFSKPSPGHNN